MLGIFFFNEFKCLLYFLHKFICVNIWVTFFIKNVDEEDKRVTSQIIKFRITNIFDQGRWELSILEKLWPNHLRNELIQFFQNFKNLGLKSFIFMLINKHLNKSINKRKLRIRDTFKPCNQLSLHFRSGAFFFVFHDATVQLLNLLFHIFFYFLFNVIKKP